MLFDIQHRTELTYSQRISESVMELRLMPRSDGNQTLRRFNLTVGPDARVTTHIDWHGNTVHQFSVVAFHDRLVIRSSATVETHPQRVDPARVDTTFGAMPKNHRLLDFLSFSGPVQRDPRIVELAKRTKLEESGRVMDAVLAVANAAREVLTYKKGLTDSLTTVAEALDKGGGVCQDFAHLGIALLRHVGVPCRYVSGYLHRPDLPEVESHAWCEAFVPPIGWVGVDPTHGELVDERHVAIASGRSYADVPPNRGVYRGEADETIAASVIIQPLEEHVGFGPYAVPFHVPSYVSPPAALPFARASALEQQRLQQQDRNKAQMQQQRQQQQ
jgi:transglutaminase-like putative cysteine protease